MKKRSYSHLGVAEEGVEELAKSLSHVRNPGNVKEMVQTRVKERIPRRFRGSQKEGGESP